ncbi:MAG: hypothetical protein GTO55_04285 [Armatimonadetes bacterium]|nr:hypothetical protein [Armatimonadota bacterium]NIM23489.1 hypothetical protein [Armatimonadota bacterium]NIM67355.1 hypothetical protein [Armatimonadota bacterium]NIM75856.1 hypothetical protein [Armatimonadota bacterium]NIN05541.1 hypothetical protein [Armatimonadota bacterium]
MKHLVFALIIAVALGMASAAFAADIVTCPTANQLKAGEVDVAGYYIFLDFPEPMLQYVRVQTLYVGVTDRLELDLHRYDLDRIAPETLWIASYKVHSEDAKMPDVVVGAKDLADRVGNPAMPRKTSYFVAAAKTLNLPAPGSPPDLPLYRLHLGVGTEDPSLLGEDRHDGAFGGIQVLVNSKIGVIALYDSADLITGVTYTPKPNWPTFKAGTFGDHTWVGINYTFGVK